MKMLKCSRCGKFKDESEFRKDKCQSRGFCYYCRQCERESALEYYHRKHPQKPKKQKIKKKTEKKRKKPQKKLTKPKAFSVYSIKLCSNLKEPNLTLCLTQIHKLAKTWNHLGKLRIDFKRRYLIYTLINRELYNKFMKEVENLKNTFQGSH